MPLVREEFSLLCSIDILFLRPGIPGTVLKSADIDARLKTIFDALRMPQNDNELGDSLAPDDGEDPFYCLVTDDKLFTHVSVATDALLEPINCDDHDAKLIIDVKISSASRDIVQSKLCRSHVSPHPSSEQVASILRTGFSKVKSNRDVPHG